MDGERPEHGSTRPDHDLVADRRVALAGIEADAAQGDTLIEGHIVADLGGLADHHAHAVIDEEAPPDPRARVDLDPGHEAADLGDETGAELPAGRQRQCASRWKIRAWMPG